MISSIAIVRMVLALTFDFIGLVHFSEVLIDSALLVVFSVLFLFAYHRPELKTIHPMFGIVYILLIALNYFQFGGINGISRLSYYAGFFVIVLIYSGWRMIGLLVFQSALLLAITYITFEPNNELKKSFLNTGSDPTNFFFALLMLGLGTYFLKTLIGVEIFNYTKLNDQLREKVSEAKSLNTELVREGKAMETAQNHLENEVNNRERILQYQQNAIETYIELNTQVLKTPVAKLNEVMKDWPDGSYSKMLYGSREELETILGKITKALESRQELNRTKIR